MQETSEIQIILGADMAATPADRDIYKDRNKYRAMLRDLQVSAFNSQCIPANVRYHTINDQRLPKFTPSRIPYFV